MIQVLIHTCRQRKWYVDKYLAPSLREQGIDNIIIYNDEYNEGQLPSLIKSYDCTNGKDTWHLQDDIIISRRFKELAEKYNNGIVCGFCNGFSRGQKGYSNLDNMWYSMPCIRIPGDIFKYFINWLQDYNVQKRLRIYFEQNKHDDVLLNEFLKEYSPRMRVWNIAPNMVNHIDHLLGGSLINKDRNKDTPYIMSKYWDEPELLANIKNLLREDCQNDKSN